MESRAESLLGWLLPGILITFLGLYVMSIRAGMQPEVALVQSGAAGALLAGVARVAVAVVSVNPPETRSRAELLDAIASVEEEPAIDPTDPMNERGTDAQSVPVNEETQLVSG